MKNHLNFGILSKIALILLIFSLKTSFSQTVQQRLDSGESPKHIFDSGFPLDSLYGKTYEEGIIFYLDTIVGNGLVCAPSDQSTGAEWGCTGTSIDGTSSAIFAGIVNTDAILAGCSTTGTAAKICDDLVTGSYTGWYLPSRSELLLMISNLNSLGLGDFSGLYWSSTQHSSTHAYTNHTSVVSQKFSQYSVRAVKCFCMVNTCPCQIVTTPVHELVHWEIFENKMSPDFIALKNTVDIPSQTISLDSLNVIDLFTSLDYFSSRIRGYIIPPLSGTYSFYFACDDAGQFWLSTDTAYANAVLKSQTDTIQTDWTQNVSSQTLVSGQKYFFEILQHDSVAINMIKLGWKIPGDSIPVTITSSYMHAYYDSIEVNSLQFVKDSILVYPNWNITPQYHVTPWNAAYKTVIWKSSDNSIATVNVDGVISTVSPGTCQIIVMSALNTTLTDTLHLTVTDYYGPFFVKENADINGDGHSWNDAIQFTKLLDILNQGSLNQVINVYVAEGTYKPTTNFNRNKTFLLNNIRMVGGFVSSIAGSDTTNRDFENYETILSGEIGIPEETMDNSYHVVVTRGGVTIDGATIRDGRANSRIYGGPELNNLKDNQGGGIYLEETDSAFVYILNSKITNNSAYNSAAGIFGATFPGSGYKTLTIRNSSIYENRIEQIVPGGGGWIIILVNGYGGGICFQRGILNMSNCMLYGNSTPYASGKAIIITACIANIDNCSLFYNIGSALDIFVRGSATLNFNKSTLIGSLGIASNSTSRIKNSTIEGGASFSTYGSLNIVLDNSIWTGLTLNYLQSQTTGDTNRRFEVNYSILGNSLIGADTSNIISSSVPDYTTWLDSLAYNGGPTPTMKLKNIPGNFALNYGNPLYLDSTDQRGAIRTGYVSIGAYQWVDATEIVISPHQLTLAQGDSIDFEVYFIPAFVSDGIYSVSSSDPSIALVDSTRLYGISTGFVNIIAQSSDGAMRDTLVCEVIVNAGIEEVNQNDLFTVYPNPVTNELTIESKGIAGNIRYEILNIFGQVVSKGFFTDRTVINTSGLCPGAYLIQCTTDKTVELLKIIKE